MTGSFLVLVALPVAVIALAFIVYRISAPHNAKDEE